MHTIQSIREKLAGQQPQLSGFHVKSLELFGSVANGMPNHRDIDIMVSFETPPTLEDFMGLKFFLEELLECSVDLVSSGSCPKRFMDRIKPELKHVA